MDDVQIPALTQLTLNNNPARDCVWVSPRNGILVDLEVHVAAAGLARAILDAAQIDALIRALDVARVELSKARP